MTKPAEAQATDAVKHMSQFQTGNDLILHVNSVLEDLVWDEERTKAFEAAIHEIGFLIGFGSQRPELDIKQGPDNLWAIGGLRYFVIECKVVLDLTSFRRPTAIS